MAGHKPEWIAANITQPLAGKQNTQPSAVNNNLTKFNNAGQVIDSGLSVITSISGTPSNNEIPTESAVKNFIDTIVGGGIDGTSITMSNDKFGVNSTWLASQIAAVTTPMQAEITALQNTLQTALSALQTALANKLDVNMLQHSTQDIFDTLPAGTVPVGGFFGIHED